jgi:hypothetical protein
VAVSKKEFAMTASRIVRLSAAVVCVGILWSNSAAGDEQSAGPVPVATWRASDADNPLAELATEPPASPPQAAPQKAPPITITFQYGERDQNLTGNVIDTRPVTAETTVGSVLAKAKSATTIFQPAEAKISVIRPHSVIGDDLSVKIVEETLNVVWDKDANRPTKETDHKLQAGDRILIKQAAPPQQFIAMAPKPQPAGVWTPTIPTPTDSEPARAFGYAVRPLQRETVLGLDVPTPPAAMAPITPAAQAADAGQVLWKIQVFTDPKGNLESFQALRTSSSMVSDSDSLLGAIAILENNKLIEFLGRPKFVGRIGRPIQFNIDRVDVANGAERATPTSTAVEINPSYANSKILALVTVSVRNGERAERIQTAANLGGQQTMIVKSPSPQGKPVYVVLTPELVSPVDPTEVQAMAPRPVRAGAPVTAYSALAYTVPPGLLAPPSIHPSQMAPGVPAQPPQAAPAAMPSPAGAAFGAVQPTQFSAPQPMPVAAPRPPDENPQTNKRSQIRFDVAIVEDTSGSMTEIIPSDRDFPCIPVDSQTMLATLRILEKHNLIRVITSSKTIATAGELATFQLEGEKFDDKNQRLSQNNLRYDITAHERGGGLAVEFKLQQNERDRNLGISIATMVAHGQTIIMKGRWQPPQQAAAAAEAAKDDAGSKAQNPVYVIVTPEPVR